MFAAPRKTLRTSLHTLLDNAPEYLADVCFIFPEAKVWAHRAILFARVPKSFQSRISLTNTTTTIDISALVPYATFLALLRFWYTAELCSGKDNEIERSAVPTLRDEIRHLEKQLACDLLTRTIDNKDDFDQLIFDLQRMRSEQLACDVSVRIRLPSQPQPPDMDNGDIETAPTADGDVDSDIEETFPAHKFMLAAQSAYFYALFCTQFSESSSSTVHLPADLFPPTVAEVILGYLYSDTLVLPPLPTLSSLSATQLRLALKKYSLRIFQQVFPAADYLGHSDTVCDAVMHEMETICHNFKCLCSDCAVLLPSMLWFGDKNVAAIPLLRPALVELYSEPVHSIAPLWSQQTFAVLVGTLGISGENRSNSALSRLASDIAQDDEPSALIGNMRQRTLANVTKHNAIHVLQSLHICLSKIRSANPFPTWSKPVLDLLDPILRHTVEMVASNFDFYCVEYPILLSCVDGIGVGFSVDFLEFLLNRVLSESMRYSNAGILYQGIVRDLVGRQEVVKNVAVDGVLIDARKRCAEYIARHWVNIKAQNGFSKVDKDTMRRMSEDTGVPYRSLSKNSIDSDFATMFSFKSRSNKYRKFFSDDVADNISKFSEKPSSLQTSIGLSSTANKLHHQKKELVKHSDTLSNPIQSFPLPSSLADALLPLDFMPLISAQQQKKKDGSDTPISRPSRLKFELPTTPLRAKSPVQKPFLAPIAAPNEHAHGSSGRLRQRGRSPRRSKWGLGGSNSDVSDDEELITMVTPVIGAKVELLRRPLPTLGTIKFVGNVNFARGTWVGVELESRLGKNDGEVEGVRYFRTDPQRGVFVKVDDFKVVSLPSDSLV
ncbi:hypothetical protein BX666DRAFT_1868623 [Dichotomocladium elegans]|nr:hypothetical protein BX666DRAFT_1868623 [Dichotomocladium elegans]